MFDGAEVALISHQKCLKVPEDSGWEFSCRKPDHEDGDWMLVELGEAIATCRDVSESLTRPELALPDGYGAYRDPDTGKWIVQNVAE